MGRHLHRKQREGLLPGHSQRMNNHEVRGSLKTPSNRPGTHHRRRRMTQTRDTTSQTLWPIKHKKIGKDFAKCMKGKGTCPWKRRKTTTLGKKQAAWATTQQRAHKEKDCEEEKRSVALEATVMRLAKKALGDRRSRRGIRRTATRDDYIY